MADTCIQHSTRFENGCDQFTHRHGSIVPRHAANWTIDVRVIKRCESVGRRRFRFINFDHTDYLHVLDGVRNLSVDVT